MCVWGGGGGEGERGREGEGAKGVKHDLTLISAISMFYHFNKA